MSNDLLKYPRIFGLSNNFGYVVMLTAAYDLNTKVCIAFFYTTILNKKNANLIVVEGSCHPNLTLTILDSVSTT